MPLLVLIVVVIVLAGLGGYRAMLRGSVTLKPVGEPPGRVRLPMLPGTIRSTDNLIGLHGWLVIAGSPLTGRMHIWIRCPGRPAGASTLRSGGQGYVCGIWVTHDTTAREDNLLNRVGPDATGL
jgi:hypothetical protein